MEGSIMCKNIHAFVIAFDERRTHIIRVIIPKGKQCSAGIDLEAIMISRFGRHLGLADLVSISRDYFFSESLITGDASCIQVIFSNSFVARFHFSFFNRKAPF